MRAETLVSVHRGVLRASGTGGSAGEACGTRPLLACGPRGCAQPPRRRRRVDDDRPARGPRVGHGPGRNRPRSTRRGIDRPSRRAPSGRRRPTRRPPRHVAGPDPAGPCRPPDPARAGASARRGPLPRPRLPRDPRGDPGRQPSAAAGAAALRRALDHPRPGRHAHAKPRSRSGSWRSCRDGGLPDPRMPGVGRPLQGRLPLDRASGWSPRPTETPPTADNARQARDADRDGELDARRLPDAAVRRGRRSTTGLRPCVRPAGRGAQRAARWPVAPTPRRPSPAGSPACPTGFTAVSSPSSTRTSSSLR